MTDLNLAELRRKMAPGFVLDYDGANEVIQAVPDLLDRIESLEAERDEASQRWVQGVQVGAAEMLRADRAEARLARVTEDRMAERIRDGLAQVTIQNGCGHETSIATDEAAEMAEWVLTAIRAVAADEQEAGR